ASGGAGENVYLWDAVTGEGLRPLQGSVGRGGDAGFWALSFSPDGKTLAGGCGRETPSLCLWDVATRKEVRRLGALGEQSATVAFSPNGKLLASAGFGGEVNLWEVLTGRKIGRVA